MSSLDIKELCVSCVALYLTTIDFTGNFREAAKNRSFFSGPATERGEGVRAWPLRKNTVFLWPLVAGSLKKD